MTSSFGARLRQHREDRGIPLSVIAAQTKIKMSLLEGLERDDVAHWPPGIFRRAYLRSYANAVGLNADAMVREFLEMYPETPEIAEPGVNTTDGNGAVQNGGAPMRLRYLVGSAVGTLSRLRRGSVVRTVPPQDQLQLRTRGTTGNHAPLFDVPDVVESPDPLSATGSHEPAESSELPESPGVAQPLAAAESHEPDPTPSASAPQPDMPAGPIAREPERRRDVDLLAAAHLCTAFGRVDNAAQMPPLLGEAARILGAPGLIVWVWDAIAEELQPALVHGYSEKVLAYLPNLKLDADNLTAAAFRTGETLSIRGNAETSGALTVPLMTPAGCAGVLAIELPGGPGGNVESDGVRAVAIVLAAMLAQLVGGGPAAASEPGEHANSDMPAMPQVPRSNAG